MSMSDKLSEEEKYERKLKREERQREKDLTDRLDKRGYEILRILRDAPNHPEVKYNSKYFEEYFRTSNITILRAVKKLKDMDLLEEKQVNGSYVIKKDVEQFYSEETQKNIALVASMRGLLLRYKDTPLYDSVTELIHFLEPKVAKEDAVFSSGRIIVPPQMEYDINVKNWDRVYEAIQKNHKIKFRYIKSYTNNDAIRIARPYQLILDNGSVYLFAYSEYADLVLLYDLNFMTDIVVTNEEFQLPKNYDFNNYCAGGRLGTFKCDNIRTFKIRFTGYAKDWIKYHKWANDQKIEKETDDFTTVSFTSAQEEKVFEEVLKWGSQAEPLAPKSLVKHWKQEITALYEKIK